MAPRGNARDARREADRLRLPDGGFTQPRQQLGINGPATTRRLCTTPAGIMEQEQASLAALQSTNGPSVGGRDCSFARRR